MIPQLLKGGNAEEGCHPIGDAAGVIKRIKSLRFPLQHPNPARFPAGVWML